MTSPYTEAFNDTNQELHLTATLLDVLYDMAMDSRTIGNSEQEPTQIMAMIEVARDKAHSALGMHEFEWKLSKEHRDEAA